MFCSCQDTTNWSQDRKRKRSAFLLIPTVSLTHTHTYTCTYTCTLHYIQVVCIDKQLSVYTNRPSRVQGSMRSGLNSGQANLAMGQARMRTQKAKRNLTHMSRLPLDHDSRCRATCILYTRCWVCCIALPCCLYMLASFFLPSSSL